MSALPQPGQQRPSGPSGPSSPSAEAPAAPAGGALLPTPAYTARLCVDADAFLQRWAALLQPGALPFHSVLWLRSWLDTLGASGGRQPVLVAVTRSDTGSDAMLLALCSRPLRLGPVTLRLVEFADATVVDYNAPLLAAGWAGDHPAQALLRARAMWRAVQALLSSGHHVLRLQKMLPATLDVQPAVANPLALALPVQPCEMHGTAVTAMPDWDSWRHTLDKRVRKEFERAWRVFTRSPGARFERITDPAVARQAYAHLEARQAERMRATGHGGYRLDQPAYSAFYRRLIEGGLAGDGSAGGGSASDGLAGGSVVLTALRDGDTWVAVQLGVANARRCIALRLCSAGGAWAACSPGRLSCERTGHHLWQQHGLPVMDLGIGAYFHKAVFQGQPVPLLDACVPLPGWRRPLARAVAHAWVAAWLWRQRIKRRAGQVPVAGG